jgi:hypothetical protein
MTTAILQRHHAAVALSVDDDGLVQHREGREAILREVSAPSSRVPAIANEHRVFSLGRQIRVHGFAAFGALNAKPD